MRPQNGIQKWGIAFFFLQREWFSIILYEAGESEREDMEVHHVPAESQRIVGFCGSGEDE